jgi:transcriptional regulator with XRE-family HTH domain
LTIAAMDFVRFGRGIRALRQRRRWRQTDLANAAGVGESVVTRVERGMGSSIAPRKLDALAQALGARLDLRLSYNGEALDRLLDADHAAIVNQLAELLPPWGWEVLLEATFWIRGERGSVDLLCWHSATRVVLIVEVKSVVPDVQAMLAAIDRKARLGRELARERGWAPVAVGVLLAIGESRTSRRRVAGVGATFASAFPHRAVETRRWLAAPEPSVPLRGLWFLSSGHRVTPRHRVRRA